MARRHTGDHDPVRIFMRRLLALVLLALVAVFGVGTWRAFRKEQESASMRRDAEVQLSELEKRQAQLEGTIHALSTDRGREAALRERYDIVRPGEGLIVIVDPPQAPEPATSSPWYYRFRFW